MAHATSPASPPIVAKSKAQPDLTKTTRSKLSMIQKCKMRPVEHQKAAARPTFVAMERTCCVVQTGEL
jgi:hypothetical protein